MNAPGFPPLPPGSRLHVDAADLTPPRLELTADPTARGGRWRVFGTAIAFGLVSLYVGVAAVGEGIREGPVGMLFGATCSLVLPAVGVGVLLGQRRTLARLWLRATPGRLETDRVWLNRSTPFTHEPKPGGPAVRDGDGLGAAAAGPLKLGDGPPFTPTLRPPDREWLRQALARVYAAAGDPAFARVAALTVAVEPDPHRRVTHPGVRVREDGPDRLVLEFPLWRVTVWRRVGYSALCLLIGSAPAGLAAAVLVFEGNRVGRSASTLGGVGVLVILGVALGMLVAAGAWRTTRIAVTARGVKVRTGWGPLRLGWGTRADRLAAVAVGGGRRVVADGPRAGRERRAATAWLVPHRPRGGRRPVVVPPGWVRLTPVPPGDDDGPFASAVAAAVADRSARFGWTTAPPVDWRFGWRSEPPP